MILIADGGSTKTTWCLLNDDHPSFFQTEGYHPFFVKSEHIEKSLFAKLPTDIKECAAKVKRVFFYSAGGGYSQETDQVLIDGIAPIFCNADIKVETDLLAAAKALLLRQSGFAAILGTGTNTCFYDGENITHNIESLGFYLGDEGSGSYIGKKIIGDYIRRFLPSEVEKAYAKYVGVTPEILLEQIYTHPTPNSFCAQSCKFVGENIGSHPYYYQLVYNSFRDLFQNIVIHYPNYADYSFNCVGSVGYHFREVLAEVVAEYNMKLGKILKEPMSGLVEFHLTNNDL